ncbi:hypothetical protein [Microvirga arabica]|uniref:hypothetical protein n=1 Tax=Microvirga arabica TaxID=1128671 RepID=UPI001AED1431|nr:hypothetical protein [Microvirga arabica]
MERALHAGGYTRAGHLELCSMAMDALVGDLHDIVTDKDLNDYDVVTRVSENGHLEITMVFATVSDAMLFKMALL